MAKEKHNISIEGEIWKKAEEVKRAKGIPISFQIETALVIYWSSLEGWPEEKK